MRTTTRTSATPTTTRTGNRAAKTNARTTGRSEPNERQDRGRQGKRRRGRLPQHDRRQVGRRAIQRPSRRQIAHGSARLDGLIATRAPSSASPVKKPWRGERKEGPGRTALMGGVGSAGPCFFCCSPLVGASFGPPPRARLRDFLPTSSACSPKGARHAERQPPRSGTSTLTKRAIAAARLR